MLLEKTFKDRPKAIPVGSWLPQWGAIWRTRWAMLRGFGRGLRSRACYRARGPRLGSFMAYVAEKQTSNKKGTFGKGDPRGVAAPSGQYRPRAVR